MPDEGVVAQNAANRGNICNDWFSSPEACPARGLEAGFALDLIHWRALDGLYPGWVSVRRS